MLYLRSGLWRETILEYVAIRGRREVDGLITVCVMTASFIHA